MAKGKGGFTGHDGLNAPDQVTGVVGIAGNEQVDVSFTSPSDEGGADITEYRVTDTTGTHTTSGSSSPVTITGLTNGTEYTFKVWAINPFGWSVASGESAGVTPAPPQIGDAFEGGYYAGKINDGGTEYYLIVAPKSGGQTLTTHRSSNGAVSGTDSVIDGPSNTSALVSDGNSPAANFCNNLTIGGYTDWYFPAKNELEVCYYNLKPSTNNNNTSSGTNTNAVPSRGSNYSSGTPSQTSVSIFQQGGSEAFPFDGYEHWSSTQYTSNESQAWQQYFENGAQEVTFKNGSRYVRAVRRVAV